MRPSSSNQAREAQQLKRLGTLVDAVFAIVLVVLVLALPYPDEVDWAGETLWGFLGAHRQALVMALIGAILVVLYWVQSNVLFGSLTRTDNRHTVMALCQVFFLLLYLYSIGLGIDFPDDAGALAFQSGLACLVGLTAAGSWCYACHNRRLLSDLIHDDEARNLKLAFMAEPITALMTIPFAFVGRFYWELAWLSYPLVARMLRRWKSPVLHL